MRLVLSLCAALLACTGPERAHSPAPPASLSAEAAAYDPLAVETSARPAPLELEFLDQARARPLPVRVYLPAEAGPAPVLLCSHGLGGSRAMGAYLGEHWAARGYVAVFLQHPGSDDAVWRGAPSGARYATLRRAASVENFRLRAEDVAAVLDQLTTWNAEAGHPLAGRLDLSRVGMSGHSFGAVTTQAVSGQSMPMVGPRFTDPRIRAALALSPSPPRAGRTAPAFGGVKIPWMLMTGTRDDSPIGDISAASRLEVYPALPSTIDKYELVLDGAEHSAFTDRPLLGEGARNPNHHRAVLALSTAFWDAHLRGDRAALGWLRGGGPRRVLDPADRWQHQAAPPLHEK